MYTKPRNRIEMRTRSGVANMSHIQLPVSAHQMAPTQMHAQGHPRTLRMKRFTLDTISRGRKHI